MGKRGVKMETRIAEHPILGVQDKGIPVTFTFDGKEMKGYEGEPIAAALKAAGVMVHRYTKKNINQEESSVRSVAVRTVSWWWTECQMCEPASLH